MPLVSKKMSVATGILRKGVFGNVAGAAAWSRRNLATNGAMEVYSRVQRHRSTCAINVQIVCAEQSAMDSDLTCDSTPPRSFDRFMAPLRELGSATPIISVRRFTASLHIDMQTLAQLAHVHRNTVNRLDGSEGAQNTFETRFESSELRPMSPAMYRARSFGTAMSHCQSSTTRLLKSWCRKDAPC